MAYFKARRLADWSAASLPLTCRSDDAAVIYDRLVAQLFGSIDVAPGEPTLYEDDVETMLHRMVALDEQFLLGHALHLAFVAFDGCVSARTSETIRAGIAPIRALLKRDDIQYNERYL